jgi:uncharacterized protein YgiM (DUF1202 family)
LGTGQADDDLASSGRTLAVKVNAANVRATPSRTSRVVTTIRRGETVEEIGDKGDWYQIRLKSGLSGWIFSDLLGPTDAPKEVEQATRSRPRPARTAPMTDLLPETAPSQSQPRTCCKHCSKGQPCGNSCISWRYTCRKPPGCAC